MKKLFAILAVAGVMASCTGGDSDKSAATDTTKKDTVMNDAKNTMNAVDTSNKMAPDTNKMAPKDTTNKMK